MMPVRLGPPKYGTRRSVSLQRLSRYLACFAVRSYFGNNSPTNEFSSSSSTAEEGYTLAKRLEAKSNPAATIPNQGNVKNASGTA